MAKVRQDQVKALNDVLTSLRSKIGVMAMDPLKLKQERDSFEREITRLKSRLEQKDAELQALKNARDLEAQEATAADNDNGIDLDDDVFFNGRRESANVHGQHHKEMVVINLDLGQTTFSLPDQQQHQVFLQLEDEQQDAQQQQQQGEGGQPTPPQHPQVGHNLQHQPQVSLNPPQQHPQVPLNPEQQRHVALGPQQHHQIAAQV